MIATTLRRAAFVALASFLPLTLSAQAETLTFDDVPVAANGLQNNFDVYGDYTFYNFNVANTTFAGTTANAVSGDQFALGGFDQSGFYRETGSFNLASIWMSFLQFDVGPTPDNSPVEIIVEGYRFGDIAPTFMRTIELTDVAQQFQFDWNGIEEVSFDTQLLTSNGRNVALTIDNVNVVPEPSSLILLAVGAAGLLAVQVRRRSSNA